MARNARRYSMVNKTLKMAHTGIKNIVPGAKKGLTAMYNGIQKFDKTIGTAVGIYKSKNGSKKTKKSKKSRKSRKLKKSKK